MRTSVLEIMDRLPALSELKLMGEGLPSPFQSSNLREPVNCKAKEKSDIAPGIYKLG
jgi:hypothetical protein